MNLVFPDQQTQDKFFRELRLVYDDLCSYASAAAPYCAIHSQADDTALLGYLNRNPLFWSSVLESLQSAAIVSLGRLHDKARNHNHLASYIREMQKQNPACSKASQAVETAVAAQQPFLTKILKLRNTVFAHTSIDAPLFAAFGFEGIKLQDFRKYWNDILTAMVTCDDAMFGTTNHSPKFDLGLFSSIEASTLAALAREA
jgi:AbiU2